MREPVMCPRLRTGPGVHSRGSQPFAVEDRLPGVVAEPIRVAVIFDAFFVLGAGSAPVTA